MGFRGFGFTELMILVAHSTSIVACFSVGNPYRKLTFEDERVMDGRNLSHAPSIPFV